jgi:hypothetical protein
MASVSFPVAGTPPLVLFGCLLCFLCPWVVFEFPPLEFVVTDSEIVGVAFAEPALSFHGVVVMRPWVGIG